MKLGLMVVLIVGLAGLSGWLFYENGQLRNQQERAVTAAKRDAERVLMAKVTAAANQLAQANEEISRLNNEINFPIEIICKKAPAGYSVQILNTFTNLLSVKVTFTNSKQNKSRSATVDLSPGFAKEIGRVEGWTASSGDSLQVECAGYQPVTRALE